MNAIKGDWRKSQSLFKWRNIVCVIRITITFKQMNEPCVWKTSHLASGNTTDNDDTVHISTPHQTRYVCKRVFDEWCAVDKEYSRLMLATAVHRRKRDGTRAGDKCATSSVEQYSVGLCCTCGTFFSLMAKAKTKKRKAAIVNSTFVTMTSHDNFP